VPKHALALTPLVTLILSLLLHHARLRLNIAILQVDVDLMLNAHLHVVEEVFVMVLIVPLLEFVHVPLTPTQL
jgi:hypothetical protein